MFNKFFSDCRYMPQLRRQPDKVVRRCADGDFYSAPQCSHCKRCTSYGNSVGPSVRLSVCLSHAGIVSKRLHVACSLHCQIANCVWFCRNQKIFPRDDLFPLKPCLKLTHPLQKEVVFDTFCLVACQR